MTNRILPMMDIGDIAVFYDGIQMMVVKHSDKVYRIGLMDEETREIKLYFRDLYSLNKVDDNGVLSGIAVWGGIERVIKKKRKRIERRNSAS